MKLTQTANFDTASVSEVDGKLTVESIQPFIEYVLAFNQNVERILRANISLADNMQVEIKTVPLRHANPTAIQTTGIPRGVIVLAQTPTTKPITSFTWQSTDSGTSVTAYFVGSNASVQVSTTLLMFY